MDGHALSSCSRWQSDAQVLIDVCQATAPVEAVACMSLVSAFGRAGVWPLAEAACLAFFRQTGHFTRLEALAAEMEEAAVHFGEAATAALQDMARAHSRSIDKGSSFEQGADLRVDWSATCV
jgi:hypothetical protein